MQLETVAPRRSRHRRSRWIALLVTQVLVTASVPILPILPNSLGSAGRASAAEVAAVVSSSGSGVEPLVPHRLLDTRDGTGGRAGRLGPGETIQLDVTGVGGVPEVGVAAVVLNVVATEATAATYVTVFPTGVERPLAANLNVVPAASIPNLVIAKVGVGGTVSLYNYTGATHLVADVQGWFAESSDIRPMTPTRLLDTRDGTGAPGAAPVGAGESLRLQVSGRGGIPAEGVGAVIMNVAVTEPTADSFLTVHPSDAERPLAANLNFVRGQTIPNLVIAKVGGDGGVDLFNYAGSTHIVADVAGWFPTGSGFEGLTPSRLLDTRDGTGAAPTPVASGTSISLQVAGRGGVPATGAAAVVLNVAVTEPTASSFLTVYPTGVERPLAANLNFVAGQTVPNLVIAKIGADGKVDLFNYAGSTHIVADVMGWFRAAEPGDGSTLELRPGTVIAGPGDVLATSGSPEAGGTVTLSGSADVPPIGGHLAVTPQPAAPDGFFGRVTGQSRGADGSTTLTLIPAILEEGFADIRVASHHDVPAGAIAIDEPVEPVAAARTTRDGQVAGQVDGRVDVARPRPTIAAPPGCEPSGGLQINPIVQLGAGRLTWKFSLRDRYVLFDLPLEATIGFSASLSGGFSCTLDLPSIPIPIPFATIDVTPSFTLSATAAITATASLTGKVVLSFESTRGNTTNRSSFVPQRSGSASATATVTLAVRPAVQTAIKLFGILGAFVNFGINFEAVFSLSELPCLWLSAQHTIDFGAEVGRWGIEWDIVLASIVGPEVRFYERSDGCPATSFMPWVGSISVSSDRAEATKRFLDAQGNVVATLTSRKSFSYTIVSTRSTLVNTSVGSADAPPGLVVSFDALTDSSEYRDASPPSSCSDLVSHRGGAPWQLSTSLTRDPTSGEPVHDPQDGETVFLLVEPALPTELRCSGGEVIVAMAAVGLYAIGRTYDIEGDCLGPAVPVVARGKCYLPVTVSEGGTRIRFNGTLRGTWDDYGFPVAMSQTVRIDLRRIVTIPG